MGLRYVGISWIIDELDWRTRRKELGVTQSYCRGNCGKKKAGGKRR